MTRSRAWSKSHRTRSGVFKIEHRVLEGSDHYILWFNDKELGAYSFAPAAAASISEGEHDQILGLEASQARCPCIAGAVERIQIASASGRAISDSRGKRHYWTG
jgi:hypothetical protein